MVTLVTGIDLCNEETAATEGLDLNMIEHAEKQNIKIENIEQITKRWQFNKHSQKG